MCVWLLLEVSVVQQCLLSLLRQLLYLPILKEPLLCIETKRARERVAVEYVFASVSGSLPHAHHRITHA